jgi:hypothetical protein
VGANPSLNSKKRANGSSTGASNMFLEKGGRCVNGHGRPMTTLDAVHKHWARLDFSSAYAKTVLPSLNQALQHYTVAPAERFTA